MAGEADEADEADEAGEAGEEDAGRFHAAGRARLVESGGVASPAMPHPRWALLAVAAACATIVLKLLAYALTGSVGILSDALESLVNLAAAVVLLAALWFGRSPPDEEHPYGHEKIEYFASGFEGALILVAAGKIVLEAAPRLLAPLPVEQVGPGAGLLLVASAINAGVAWLLMREGRRRRSLALEADGRHLFTDVVTSGGVVAGLVLVAVTGVTRLDPLIAIAVALQIVWTGVHLLQRSVQGLLDQALTPAELLALRQAIQGQLPDGATYHALRTRRSGTRSLADVHVLVPGDVSVRDGHALATAVEEAVRAVLPGTEITVHVEPLEGERGPGHVSEQAIAQERDAQAPDGGPRLRRT